jgi:hypothetical protein
VSSKSSGFGSANLLGLAGDGVESFLHFLIRAVDVSLALSKAVERKRFFFSPPSVKNSPQGPWLFATRRSSVPVFCRA